MKIVTTLAVVSLLATGGAAFAQTPDAPATVAPPATTDMRAATPARPDVRETGTVDPSLGKADPNRTGPDVVNGLEVPAMKNPKAGGRE